MFHHFHDERKHYKGQGSISMSDFEAILMFVGLDRILDPKEWLKRLGANQLTNRDVCITLDDGLLCQFDVVLPVLDKYNLKAFWFVYSSVFEGGLGKFEIYRVFRSKFFKDIDDFYNIFFDKIFQSKFGNNARKVLEETDMVRYSKTFPFYSTNDMRFRLIRDRVLSREEFEIIMDAIIQDQGLNLADLSKNIWMSNENLAYLNRQGHVIGLHSYSHPMMLAELPFERQQEEYQKNYEHIQRVCGRPPVDMAHPANSYNDSTLKILSQLGVECGFKSNMFPRDDPVRDTTNKHTKKAGGRSVPVGDNDKLTRHGCDRVATCLVRDDPSQLNKSKYEIAREDHANIMRMMTRPVRGTTGN
ncbi:MAG: polysaccharide deacetylase family protein [Candidatus Yanofskybacteria bacterium]|nr:polysaccharide deacetylase family protein [Candidatus Yanofskybacteria bacterium]